MATSYLSEDQFLCSICLEVFTDPVTIPCGHNFCKTCITENWNISLCCQCPLCVKVFHSRPELCVNTILSEMVDMFKQSTVKKNGRAEEQQAESGEVSCEVCSETKMKAVKSCLQCLTSYCRTHLEPHRRVTGLKRHQLIDPVKNLEDRMCKEHNRPLELFCKTDRMPVCELCKQSNHKGHLTIPLKTEYEQKKAEVEAREGKIHQMIRERQKKINNFRELLTCSKEAAEREKTVSEQIFDSLIKCIEESRNQLDGVIEGMQKTTESQAQGFIKELEKEVSELRMNISELEQLSHTGDHLQFLQSLPSLNPVPPTKDWTEVTVHSSYEGIVKKAVAQLEQTLSKEMKKLHDDVELKRVQQYAVDVTLDPDTAHPNLVLSDDGKQVSSCNKRQNFPETPKRCIYYANVLGKQGFSSGRFYYEVQVNEKTQWDLGVANESINRKEKKPLCPKNGYWTIRLRNGNQYKAVVGPSICLSLQAEPQKVGVFVDYEEGLVSFYDVGAAALIYSFTGCNFTEKLYPLFSPCFDEGGANSTPLIISSVLPKH
ncbi:E3 ubiquitin-protein ligase TRIM39-like [Simochromis diagramma]|uniref:E3 ubiquitin-protein ligase TRIM39-like n=1 Tax=Simochromis diagramma TaxID=43689 RepID=UPI001A7ED9E8|nr:E3 ubiquitin-protein ligase TRIM39-like [Simochromis diagramma]XP_039906760.1 E3 ubiquitin-protein ligase TRIM39-like [Simochromis diagramma]